jgi:hypothetical protein
MLRGVIVCVFLVSVLAGCTSNIQMADGKGQSVECRTTSFGLLGTLIAASMQQTCVDDLQKQGYHEVAAAPSSPPAAATGQAKQQ